MRERLANYQGPIGDILDKSDAPAITPEERDHALKQFELSKSTVFNYGGVHQARFITQVQKVGPLIGSKEKLPEFLRTGLPADVTEYGHWVYHFADGFKLNPSSTIQNAFGQNISRAGSFAIFDDKKELFQVMVGLLVGKVPSVSLVNDPDLRSVVWRHLDDNPTTRINTRLNAAHRIAATILYNNYTSLGTNTAIAMAVTLLHSQSSRARKKANDTLDKVMEHFPHVPAFREFCDDLRKKSGEELHKILREHSRTEKILAQFIKDQGEPVLFPIQRAFRGQWVPHPWPDAMGTTRHHSTLNRGMTAMAILLDYVEDHFNHHFGRKPNTGIRLN